MCIIISANKYYNVHLNPVVITLAVYTVPHDHYSEVQYQCTLYIGAISSVCLSLWFTAATNLAQTGTMVQSGLADPVPQHSSSHWTLSYTLKLVALDSAHRYIIIHTYPSTYNYIILIIIASCKTYWEGSQVQDASHNMITFLVMGAEFT